MTDTAAAGLPDRSEMALAVDEYRDRVARLSALLGRIGVHGYVGSTPETCVVSSGRS